MLNVSDGGLLIHNFGTGQDEPLPIDDEHYDPNSMAEFSTDGRYFFLQNQVSRADGTSFTHLTIFDLSTNPPAQHDVESPNDSANDLSAIWGLDSNTVIVARAPSVLTGDLVTSLYQTDLNSGSARLLVKDDGYHQDNMQLSPAGDALVFERSHPTASVPDASIWVFNLTDGKLDEIAPDATEAAWLP